MYYLFIIHSMAQKRGEQLSKRPRNCRPSSIFCLRRILKISWTDRVTNEMLWELAGEEPIITQISKRKWRWIGHILRKPANNITRQALRWNPQGKRKRGRPRNSWRRGVESQMRNWGHTWATLGRFAQDRTRWRTELVNGLCSNRS